MSDMFNNYPQPEGYIPDNRFRCFPDRKISIMAGETTVHSFGIPFDIESDTTDYCVIYKLGLENILVKHKEELEVIPYDEETGESILTALLSVEDTLLFKDTLLDAFVQIKFTLVDGTTIFTEVYPVHLQDSLDIKNEY